MRIKAARVCENLRTLTKSKTNGTVHSVFENAVNIDFSGQICTLLNRDRPLVPFGAQLEDTKINALGLQAGDEAYAENGIIAIRSRNVFIDIEVCETVSLSIYSFGEFQIPDEERRRMKLSAIAEALVECESADEGIAPVLAAYSDRDGGDALKDFKPNSLSVFMTDKIKRLAEFLNDAKLGFIRVAKPKAEAIGVSVSGAGFGLTPSSDDFLVGVVSALHSSAVRKELDHVLVQEICSGLCEGAAKNTGTISANFIISAKRGVFGEDILKVLTAYHSAKSNESLKQAAREMTLYGATSGADALAGIWFGFTHIL